MTKRQDLCLQRRSRLRDYFYTANHHWLEVHHVDGFRYDCVPNYWDGPLGPGYANLVYQTHQLTKAKIAAGDPYWSRFDAGPGKPLWLVQMAEQLEGPEEVLRTTYSNSTWQNSTIDAARAVARGDRGRLADLGLRLGLFGYPDQEVTNGDDIPKAGLQYIENHDHERFLCNFGTHNPDEAQNPLFAEGDRNRGALLDLSPDEQRCAYALARGGVRRELFLPDIGTGRVSLLRPLRWDFFYDDSGRPIVSLVRKLLRIRRLRHHIRRATFFFFNATPIPNAQENRAPHPAFLQNRILPHARSICQLLSNTSQGTNGFALA
jgi:maltooligosyltrehalose trehalohydrolase